MQQVSPHICSKEEQVLIQLSTTVIAVVSNSLKIVLVHLEDFSS